MINDFIEIIKFGETAYEMFLFYFVMRFIVWDIVKYIRRKIKEGKRK